MSVTRSVRRLGRPLHWRLASALPLPARRHYLHLANTGRWGNFSDPTTYNEKMNWRILNDRRLELTQACDKLAMKDTARALVPSSEELRIPATFWTGRCSEEIPDVRSLPAFVVKPNHGSGDILFGPIEQEQLITETRGWFQSKVADQLGEWGYQHARPLLLIEERIPSTDRAPIDYKFFVFDGTVRFIQGNQGRFGSEPSWSFYTPQWEHLPVGRRGYRRDPLPRPDNLERMIGLAQRLAADWDHLRVDLYSERGEIWFGELSPYHHGGVFPFDPPEFDTHFGAFWTLPVEDGAR